jgi:CDP-paratose 2-epimerase
VYSIAPLAALPVRVVDEAFEPAPAVDLPDGMTADGVAEAFSTAAPVSLYGATKVASEQLALEYGAVFNFPVWINRCGVLAGAGQFGKADQGIFSYWINSWLRRRPLKYIGFGGTGHQVRDCLHPADLVPLLDRQLAAPRGVAPPIVNVGGGTASARSLSQVSAWCRDRLGDLPIGSSPQNRPFDLPWMVLDAGLARTAWKWAPARTTDGILDEILAHARQHPQWLELSDGGHF